LDVPRPTAASHLFPILVRALGGRAFAHGTAYHANSLAGAALGLPPGIDPDHAEFEASLRKGAKLSLDQPAPALKARDRDSQLLICRRRRDRRIIRTGPSPNGNRYPSVRDLGLGAVGNASREGLVRNIIATTTARISNPRT
jgi:hypothetical protein